VRDIISVSVLSLKDLFSDDFHFRLPYFQRAYAWQTEQAGRLLSDIMDAMRRDANRGYFLGKLMLAKKKDQPDTALVDGHQRVMTLTVLFAVLRDIESDAKRQERLQSFIRGQSLRLSPQEAIANSCERYVQAPGATSVEPEEGYDGMSESEQNLIENRNYLRAEFASVAFPPEVRRALIDYLADKCAVMVSSIEDEDEAWAFLRIEEETRVDFSKADRAKFNLLAIVPAAERAECQAIWESCEAMLGATDMHALLGHLRTLKRRKQSGKPVEVEIADIYKFNVPGAGAAFLRNQLKPAAEHLAALRNPAANPFGVGKSVERLSWIDTQLWVPAALLWLEKSRDANETVRFFQLLERLVWMMRIAGFDPTKQHTRILQLMGEIDRGVSVAKMRELEVTGEMREKALLNLRSPSFDAKHFSGRVLRRVSIALGEDPGPIERDRLTIEHVLPKSFDPKSAWCGQFSSSRLVKQYAHRLGNLTFLSPAENQAADSFDWSVKRPILAGSSCLLSRSVAEKAEWAPQQIHARTEELIGILFKDWEIKV
jgi:hypothetical protein